jgi:hypothetical protein
MADSWWDEAKPILQDYLDQYKAVQPMTPDQFRAFLADMKGAGFETWMGQVMLWWPIIGGQVADDLAGLPEAYWRGLYEHPDGPLTPSKALRAAKWHLLVSRHA